MSAEKTSGSKSREPSRTVGAIESLAKEIEGVQESELVHINIDVVAAVTTALCILPKLEKLKEPTQSLPNFQHAMVDKFETYAMALYEAHADYLSASRPVESLPALVERGTLLRDRLYADGQALIARDLVNAQEIREVRTSNGYKALAMDLTLLADAVQRRWPALQGKTAIQLEEVLEVERLATNLLRVIGEKEQAPAVVADASAKRARAFALFVRAYDEVRRAVTYLRWKEGDADLIAPSLYQSRMSSRRKSEPEAPATPANPTSPVAPTPANATTTAPGASPPAVGFPDSEPFTRN